MTNPNPFQQAPAPAPQQPTISDAAAQQFGAPAQQAAPNAFQQQAHEYAAVTAQGQHPVQQAYAQQAPAQPQQQFPGQVTPAEMQAHQQQVDWNQVGQNLPQAYPGQAAQVQAPPVQPQGLPGQPWTPQQHETYNQMRENGMSAAPAGWAPPVAPPVQPQVPAPAPQGLPQAPFPGQRGHVPSNGLPDLSMFAPPSQGGGTFPKVRDLDGRLCLFRVKDRNKKGTAYKSTTETINYVVNVAVLDGGPLWSSPADDQPMAQPELVTETLPYVVGDMTIGPKGLQNRLKADFVRGRVVRMPMGEFEKQLLGAFPGMEGWQALATWIAQAPGNINLLAAGTYFWGIVEDTSPQADQLIAAFAQHPIARELML